MTFIISPKYLNNEVYRAAEVKKLRDVQVAYLGDVIHDIAAMAAEVAPVCRGTTGSFLKPLVMSL